MKQRGFDDQSAGIGGEQDGPPWYFGFYKTIGLSVVLDDWHPDFLRNYSTDEWVELVTSTGLDLAALQAKCHSGNAYYVTELDHLHAGLNGVDAFGQQLAGFHKHGIKVWANISLVFDNYLFERHPDWRLRNKQGQDSKEARFVIDSLRPGVLCINSPYRDFAIRSLQAFARKYEVDYLHLDMLFVWTPICYCRHCRDQYLEEFDRHLPEDTMDPEYPNYVRWRNARHYSFTEELLAAFKEIRPEAATLFNSPRPHLPVPHSPVEMANLADAIGGDPVQDDPSPAAVAYSASAWVNMKPDRPPLMCIGRFHEHEGQHTGLRSVEELQVATLIAAAYNCAIMLIDVPRPDGTLYESAYRTFREVFTTADDVKPFFGGDRMHAAAIYVSEDTRRYYYETSPGVLPQERYLAHEHVSGLKETFRTLHEQHIPVDVITKLNLEQLDQFSLLCISDNLLMSEPEIAAIRSFVESGGSLLATRYSSLADEDGRRLHNFALADVFGVDYLADSDNQETYVSVARDLSNEAEIPDDMEVKFDAQALVRAREGTEVLGTLVLPYSDRRYDAHKWASAFGSPPGVSTDYPSIVKNSYGKGVCIYVAARLNTLAESTSAVEPRALIGALARRLLGPSPPLTVDGPPWLVATGYRQQDRGRLVLHLVNAQSQTPLQVLEGVVVAVNLQGDEKATSVLTGLNQEPIKFSQNDRRVSFEVPEVRLYTPTVILIQ